VTSQCFQEISIIPHFADICFEFAPAEDCLPFVCIQPAMFPVALEDPHVPGHPHSLSAGIQNISKLIQKQGLNTQ